MIVLEAAWSFNFQNKYTKIVILTTKKYLRTYTTSQQKTNPHYKTQKNSSKLAPEKENFDRSLGAQEKCEFKQCSQRRKRTEKKEKAEKYPNSDKNVVS